MLPGPPIDTEHPWGDEATPYEAIGGDEGVRRLVESFYDIIESESPDLRAMLPQNTSTSRQKLYEYFSEWLGGPTLYSDKRGHPRLRMRHLPFSIGDPEATEWMRCMDKAMDESGVSPSLKVFLDQRLGELALHMRNR